MIRVFLTRGIKADGLMRGKGRILGILTAIFLCYQFGSFRQVPVQAIVFEPLYKQRVWGGRSLETDYGRKLPSADDPYGESWELVDRPDEQSVVKDGPFAGKTLGELWTESRSEIFGEGLTGERFPLLIKVLDARDDLSIQVHPPVELAEQLGGEPKTEMWYIAAADPGATLYVGVKDGVTEETFRAALEDGSIADQVHAIRPQTGESIFIPSGRLHAIGAGLVIFEIQQNSDTTYRVFDWNRLGLDGQPRDLHVEESMKCIDFSDVELGMDSPRGDVLASCEHFTVSRAERLAGEVFLPENRDQFAILAVEKGSLEGEGNVLLRRGDFALLPRGVSSLVAAEDSSFLIATL